MGLGAARGSWADEFLEARIGADVVEPGVVLGLVAKGWRQLNGFSERIEGLVRFALSGTDQRERIVRLAVLRIPAGNRLQRRHGPLGLVQRHVDLRDLHHVVGAEIGLGEVAVAQREDFVALS